MRALWFLTWRLLVNSVRRTLRQPVRAVALALVVGWFGFTTVGNLLFALSSRMRATPHLPADFRLISMDNLVALIMAVHLTMLWQPLSPWTGFASVPLFTPADVNFLFPSPQKRLSVFFFLLLTRGVANSIFTLLILVLLVLIAGQDLLVNALTGRHPANVMLGWTYPLMYLLAFGGLLFSGIFVSLREEKREGFRRRVAAAFWCVVGVIAGILGAHGYRAWSTGYDPLQEVVWHALHNPMVAIPLLPIRALAEAALVFYNGWTPYVTAGFLLWAGFAAWMAWLLVREEGWLYELAVRMSTLTTVYTLRRQGPAYAAYADALSQASSLRGRASRWWLSEKWTPQGVWALLWCNGLLLWRMAKGTMLWWTVFLSIAVAAVTAFFRSDEPEMYPAMGAIMLYTGCFFLVLGFTQVVLLIAVRRSEMNRSLPFRAHHIVWMEVLPPSMYVWFLAAIMWGAFCVFFPQKGLMLVSHYLTVFSLAPLWHAALFLVYLFVPDQSDYTQRVLLGLLLLPLLLLVTLPTLGIWALAAWLSLPTVAIILLLLTANALATWGMVVIVGERYMHTNLAE